MLKLTLASTSPWRLRILRDAGLDVEAVAPDVGEEVEGAVDPVDLVRALALRKAGAVARRRPGDWILGADQVAWDPATGSIWGKPPDAATHLARLAAMRGRPHHLVTGFALVGPDLEHVGVERTVMWVRAELADAELRAYVATGEGAGCAGGYAAEGLGAFLFERIEGDWNNVLGLPLFRVLTVLRGHGWRFGGAP